MTIRDYWLVLSKRWWLFLLTAAIAATTAYAYSKAQQPIFRSSAKLYVMPARPDYGNVLFTQNVVRQYSQLLKSDRFLAAINDDMRLDLPLAALKEKVTTSGTADNLALQIDVDDPDPGLARAIAKSVALKFIEDQQLRMKTIPMDNRIDVQMYDEPTPAVLYQPQTRVNVMAAGLLGLLLGGIVAFVLEYLDDTIKGTEDVERYVALPVVGLVPRMPA